MPTHATLPGTYARNSPDKNRDAVISYVVPRHNPRFMYQANTGAGNVYPNYSFDLC